MRTVDPESWSKKFKKRSIKVSRCNKYGQQPYTKYESIIRESLVDTALEYWENCSLPVVKFINMEDTSKIERYGYIIFLFGSLALGVLILMYNYQELFLTSPLEITSHTSAILITNISFPAVAFCSNNIIHRDALENYVDYLYNQQGNQKNNSYNRSEIEKNLMKMGALLNLALPPLQRKFDTFLHEVDPGFNISDIMFKFTPPCSSILTRCIWRGILVSCETLFALRITPLGFCCVFNSRYYSVDANNEPQVLDLIGQNCGLGVVITENTEKFAYVRRNVFGAEMLLFEGSEYPLLESGDVHLYPVPRNQSLFVNIRSLTQTARDDIEVYNEERRGCRSHGPGQSWCLTSCRRDTFVALCDCVPYSLHDTTTDDNRRVCGLRDLPCLNKHREKFMYLYPVSAREAHEHLSEELQDSLFCDKCRVLCRRQRYSAHISYANYESNSNIYHTTLTKDLSLVNASIIHLFYNHEHQAHYVLEARGHWYEHVARLATQWVFLVGVSMLCIAELIYHVTIRLIHHLVKRIRLMNLRPPATSTL